MNRSVRAPGALFVVLSSLLLAASAGPWAQSGPPVITFSTSGAVAAQPAFLRGVGLLHVFDLEGARAAFLEARRADPAFAMAYWGEAMTHLQPLAAVFRPAEARAALSGLAATPAGRLGAAGAPVEKEWLAALDVLLVDGEAAGRMAAYASAMGRMHDRYPADDEVTAFYALALLGTSGESHDPSPRMRAAGLLEELRERRPLHPGAVHYLIRAYDDPVHAPLGLRAADAYARMRPEAADAQHLASHIYVALGLWDEAAAASERAGKAAAASLARLAASSAGTDLRVLLWQEYSYLQSGRYAAARAVLRQLDAAGGDSPAAREYQALGRAAWVVETRRWIDARSPVGGTELPAAAAAADAFAVGLAAVKAGDRAGAQTALQQIAALAEDSPVEARPGRTPGLSAVMPSAALGRDRRVAAVMAQQLEAALLFIEGRREEGLVLARQAAVVEDALPSSSGPPSPVKPAHELVGEMLMDLRRPAEAVREFEAALSRFPRRALSLLGVGRAASAARDRDRARAAYGELARVWHDADKTLPELKELTLAPQSPSH